MASTNGRDVAFQRSSDMSDDSSDLCNDDCCDSSTKSESGEATVLLSSKRAVGRGVAFEDSSDSSEDCCDSSTEESAGEEEDATIFVDATRTIGGRTVVHTTLRPGTCLGGNIERSNRRRK